MLDVSKLLTADCYDHPVSQVRLLETHISWVILTGPFAYKIKKPVNLGFLDFSTLDKRHHFCEEELRLNRRLAPHIYLAVVPICGTPEQPRFGLDSEAIDFAVKMRQFPQSAQLDRMLAQGELTTTQLDAIAEKVAHFHQNIDVAATSSDFGSPEQVWHPVTENFDQIRERETDKERINQLDALYRWSRGNFGQLTPTLRQRKQDGFVRECHGDLHLRNIAWVEEDAVIFDCIEFNPNLRWIDVMSDLAFLFMDLIDRDQVSFSYRLLDRYLSITGDYAGLSLLPFYVVYRAMVRAKVSRIRLSQMGSGDDSQDVEYQLYDAYLALASKWQLRSSAVLFITWGMSASGKSTVSGALLESLHAIRIRSDVERKRLAGLNRHESATAPSGKGIYTSNMTQKTYDYLWHQAAGLLDAGFVVIIDATFLDYRNRQAFAELAQEKAVPFFILQCTASADCLRRRIQQRQGGVSDADIGILEQQLAHKSSLLDNELQNTINIDTEQDLDIEHLTARIQARIAGANTRGV